MQTSQYLKCGRDAPKFFSTLGKWFIGALIIIVFIASNASPTHPHHPTRKKIKGRGLKSEMILQLSVSQFKQGCGLDPDLKLHDSRPVIYIFTNTMSEDWTHGLMLKQTALHPRKCSYCGFNDTNCMRDLFFSSGWGLRILYEKHLQQSARPLPCC